MKKIFLFIMIGACFYSCSKDSPSPIQNNHQILGKWKFIKEIEIDSLPPYSRNGQHFDSEVEIDTMYITEGSYYNFTEDGTFYSKSIDLPGDYFYDTAKYVIKGSKIKFQTLPNSETSFSEEAEIKTLNDTCLIIYIQGFDPAVSEETSYSRANYYQLWLFLRK